MNLSKLYSEFRSRISSYSYRVSELRINKSKYDTWEFNYQTETLISDIWQSWCNFSRTLYLSSCRGTIARNGNEISPISDDLSWKRLAYIAKRKLQNNSITANGHQNFALRLEPTWGDLDVFVKVVIAVQPSNVQNLISAYGSFSNIKHLQKVRNACAHKNIETLTELNSLNHLYGFSRLNMATEFVWTIHSQSKTIAIELWLYEISKIADLSTETS